jgi:hypothetical protein
MPDDAVATSSDFDSTRMFYGNAFETLGSLLDLPAAVNNILLGRPFDQMATMTLAQFRTINKAGGWCFSNTRSYLGLWPSTIVQSGTRPITDGSSLMIYARTLAIEVVVLVVCAECHTHSICTAAIGSRFS